MHSDKSTSDLFSELLPTLNCRSVELLDHDRAIGQLATLERRAGRSGRDQIRRRPNGHDDIATSIAGAVWLAGTAKDQRGVVSVGFIRSTGELVFPQDNPRPRFRMVTRSEEDRQAERVRDAANAAHNRRYR